MAIKLEGGPLVDELFFAASLMFLKMAQSRHFYQVNFIFCCWVPRKWELRTKFLMDTRLKFVNIFVHLFFFFFRTFPPSTFAPPPRPYRTRPLQVFLSQKKVLLLMAGPLREGGIVPISYSSYGH